MTLLSFALAWFAAMSGCEDDKIEISAARGFTTTLDLKGYQPPLCRTDVQCVGRVDTPTCTGARCTAEGTCVAVALADGAPCDDADPCTTDDSCAAGECGGAPRRCNDDDPCTTDSCDATAGCVSVPRDCPEDDGLPCIIATCDPVLGRCVAAPVDDQTVCDDGLSCTSDDRCDKGLCVGELAAECDDDEPCTVDSCTAEGCKHTPRTGDCDDEDACTLGDTCDAGVCRGVERDCSDGNPCTEDRCGDGICIYETIPDCVEPKVGCDDKAAGDGCSDGDPLTIADVCIAGKCAGFEVVEVTASGAEDLRFHRVARATNTWWLAAHLANTSDEATGVIGTIDGSTAFTPVADTRGRARMVDMHGGLAIDDAGALWVLDDGAWDKTHPLSVALADSGTGRLHAIFGFEDIDGVRLWIVGAEAAGGPFFRYCTTVGLAVTAGIPAECNAQGVPILDEPTVRAVAGNLACDSEGACAATLVAGSDLFQSTGADGVNRYYNDIYRNAGSSLSSWIVAVHDPGPSRNTTEDMAGLGGAGAIAVGGHGYVRHNAGDDGTFSNTAAITDGQSDVHFAGVWADADAVVVIGTRVTAGAREVEVFVADRSGDLRKSDWTRHELGAVLGQDAGVFDVWGTSAGEVVIVGASRAAEDSPYHGLIYRRRPPSP